MTSFKAIFEPLGRTYYNKQLSSNNKNLSAIHGTF